MHSWNRDPHLADRATLTSDNTNSSERDGISTERHRQARSRATRRRLVTSATVGNFATASDHGGNGSTERHHSTAIRLRRRPASTSRHRRGRSRRSATISFAIHWHCRRRRQRRFRNQTPRQRHHGRGQCPATAVGDLHNIRRHATKVAHRYRSTFDGSAAFGSGTIAGARSSIAAAAPSCTATRGTIDGNTTVDRATSRSASTTTVRCGISATLPMHRRQHRGSEHYNGEGITAPG